MQTTFLLVTDRKQSGWTETLRYALSPLGTLQVIAEEAVSTGFRKSNYALIIIDATSVSEPARLISSILLLDATARIVVATVSPTWQEARTVLKAGALDYFRRPASDEELVAVIQGVLRTPGF